MPTEQQRHLRTFSNRFEKKYVIDIATYQNVRKSFEPFFVRDEHTGPQGKYRVLSVYYDSDDYRAFREKIDGEKERAKLRLRIYAPFKPSTHYDENMIVFLEIKKKNDQIVYKERIPLKYKLAKQFIQHPKLDDSLIKNLNKREVDALTQTAKMKAMLHLKPKILIHYIREPFVSKYHLDLRVTFDTCLRYRKTDLRLATKNSDKWVIPPHLMIMELKYTEKLPLWIINTFQKYNCQLQTYSKYCNGLIRQFETNKELIY